MSEPLVATVAVTVTVTVTVTEHADTRMKERLGLPRKARQAAAQRAFDRGKRHADVSGRLRRFLDAKWFDHHCDNVRIYGEHIWFFRGTTLVTVYEIKKDLKGGIK